MSQGFCNGTSKFWTPQYSILTLSDASIIFGNMNTNKTVKYVREVLSDDEMLRRSHEQFVHMDQRRTVREFSTDDFPIEILDNCIRAASTAPSGAHMQPWTFCIVSDPEIKKAIRGAAEKEEYDNYNKRMNDEWLDDLAPLGTDWHKPFLETCPYLIVVFKQSYGIEESERKQHYYVNESVGIACGFLLEALHSSGLVALTHTPSPMKFLKRILKRPSNEQPYLLIPVGKPLPETEVPDLKRKELNQVRVKYA